MTDQAPMRGICSKIIMDIIQMREDLDYESGDYDIDMMNDAKREAYNNVLNVIDRRIAESEMKK